MTLCMLCAYYNEMQIVNIMQYTSFGLLGNLLQLIRQVSCSCNELINDMLLCVIFENSHGTIRPSPALGGGGVKLPKVPYSRGTK